MAEDHGYPVGEPHGDAILEAVAFAAQRFLEKADWREAGGEVLHHLGVAAHVSRTYIFENHMDELGRQVCSQLFEWSAPGVEAFLEDPELQAQPWVEAGFGRWVDVLGRGDPVVGLTCELPEIERPQLERQQIRSILIVPVFVGTRWWGTIGFDDCAADRIWTQAELDALRAAAGILGAVIQRARAEARVREAEAKYRAIVENVPVVIYAEGIEADPAELYLSPQVERILGYTLGEWTHAPGFWIGHLHPDDRERVIADNDRADRTQEDFITEYRFLAKDGSWVWLRDEAVLVRDEQGSPRHWQGCMIDITERKRAEHALARAEARFRTLVEHIPAITYVESLDADSSQLYISPQAEEILGYTPDEWRDTPGFWVDRIHPHDRNTALAEDARTNETGDPVRMEYRFLAKDGTYRWIRDEALLVRDAEFTPPFWQGFMLDITERKRAEEALRENEERYRDLFENANDLIYTHDLRGTLTSMNKATTLLLGYGPTEVVGYDISRFVTPEHLHVVREMVSRGLAGAPVPAFEIDVIARDGKRIPIELNIRLTNEDGSPAGVQTIARDITERKRAERELEHALTVEREATQRLRAVDDMKNTFLQAVSHDLRTPLAAILGLAVTLGRRDLELGEGEARELADRIASNARKLDRLVTDLLDLDRLGRGIVEPSRQRTELSALLRRVVTESELANEREVEVGAVAVTADVDPAKVERIVENLLANTARHTPANTSVWVRAEAVEGGVVLVVEDDGTGVPEEEWAHIFEPFRQGSDAPMHSPGIGVGLTLVARFAELHGGQAWVEEREGGGASFRVFLADATRDPAGDVEPTGDSGGASPNGSGSPNRATGPDEHAPMSRRMSTG